MKEILYNDTNQNKTLGGVQIMDKNIFVIKNTCLYEGLEKIDNIYIIANQVFVGYTVSDDYMKKNGLIHKNRILQINPITNMESLKAQDYANPLIEINDVDGMHYE